MKKAEKQGILSLYRNREKEIEKCRKQGDEDGADTGHEKTQESDRT